MSYVHFWWCLRATLVYSLSNGKYSKIYIFRWLDCKKYRSQTPPKINLDTYNFAHHIFEVHEIWKWHVHQNLSHTDICFIVSKLYIHPLLWVLTPPVTICHFWPKMRTNQCLLVKSARKFIFSWNYFKKELETFWSVIISLSFHYLQDRVHRGKLLHGCAYQGASSLVWTRKAKRHPSQVSSVCISEVSCGCFSIRLV